MSDIQKHLQKRLNLPGRNAVDAHSAAGVQIKLVFSNVIPGAHQNPEIRIVLFAEKVFPNSSTSRSTLRKSKSRPGSMRRSGPPASRTHIPQQPKHPA
jgi:hypothetical protein